MPAVEQLWSYGETGYHSLAAAVVKQRYKREAMASAFRILGEGQLSLTKFLLVTDRAVDLKDFRATLTHILERTHPETDLYVFSNLSMDTLDYTGPVVNEGSKGVWLGLGDPVRELPARLLRRRDPAGDDGDPASSPPAAWWSAALPTRTIPAPRPASPPTRPSPAGRWSSSPTSPAAPPRARSTSSGPPSPASSRPRTSTPPPPRLVRHHVSYKPPILIDARMKPWYPEELFADEETAATVTPALEGVFPGREGGDGGFGGGAFDGIVTAPRSARESAPAAGGPRSGWSLPPVPQGRSRLQCLPPGRSAPAGHRSHGWSPGNGSARQGRER